MLHIYAHSLPGTVRTLILETLIFEICILSSFHFSVVVERRQPWKFMICGTDARGQKTALDRLFDRTKDLLMDPSTS